MKPELLNILVIDDEPAMRHMLRLVLEQQGYRLTEAQNGVEALEKIAKERFDAILCDIRMQEMDGLEFLCREEVKTCPATIIMMSAYGSIDTAIECLKLGAYDYISKPFKPDEVVLTLKKAEERLQLQRENRRLKKELASSGQAPFTIDEIIHASDSMAQIIQTVTKVAATEATVLISGETGTGKELIARALHGESRRRDSPFLALNCSAIATGLLESELFGHAKGAFTGADRNKEGLFAAASGGTLFLDEIAELPLDLQPKLLRVLQESEIRPVGTTVSQPIDTRVVAACGIDLARAVTENRFRGDLYYRLAVVEIALPPLRERPADIIILARHFIEEIARRENYPQPALDEETAEQLLNYHWPGNVRELRNFLEKAMIFSRRGELELPPLPIESRRHPRNGAGDFSLKLASRRLEEEYIRKALAHTNDNRTQAAKLLQISLRSLMYKLKEYAID